MNTQKYEIYKSIHESLSKALKYGFYYEAIFLEYAVIDDRLASVLKYAGIPYIDKNGQDVSVSKKLDLIESRKELSDKFYRDRLTKELIQECRDWIKERNDLIHHIANLSYDSELVHKVAVEGNELVKKIKNKSASVINRLKKNA